MIKIKQWEFLLSSFLIVAILFLSFGCDGGYEEPHNQEPAIYLTEKIVSSIDKIVFASNQNGNYEIYVINIASNPNNSTIKKVTNHPADDIQPTISPDGTKIAFVSNRDGYNEIYVMDVDGSNLTRLTKNDAEDIEPCWSPDGKKIAFSSNMSGNYQIYIIDADGSNLTQVTIGNDDKFSPCWSPDGSKIAFISDRYGSFDIWIASIDLTRGTCLLDCLLETPDVEGSPSWSSDGKSIAFTRWYKASKDRPSREICIMNADGKNERRLTRTESLNWDPIWSPDGKAVIFVSNKDGDNEIYSINIDGSNEIKITDNNWNDESPSFSLKREVPPLFAPISTGFSVEKNGWQFPDNGPFVGRGMCVGMSLTAGLAFKKGVSIPSCRDPYLLPEEWQSIIKENDKNTENILKFIQSLVKPVSDEAIISSIYSSLKNGVPCGLVILKGIKNHFVLAYAIEEKEKDKSYLIKVYDPNHPGNNKASIEFKKTTRDKESKISISDYIDPNGEVVGKVVGVWELKGNVNFPKSNICHSDSGTVTVLSFDSGFKGKLEKEKEYTLKFRVKNNTPFTKWVKVSVIGVKDTKGKAPWDILLSKGEEKVLSFNYKFVEDKPVGIGIINNYNNQQAWNYLFNLSMKTVLKGRISEQGTNRALSGADISIRGTNIKTKTDAQGYYRFDGISPGTIKITISKQGYVTQEREISIAKGQVIVLDASLSPKSQVNGDGSKEQLLYTLGKEEKIDIAGLLNRRWYMIGENINRKKKFVVLDGEKGPEYDYIESLTFSLEGKRYAYVANIGGKWGEYAYTGGKWFVVIDGKKSPEYDYIGSLTFSSDWERYAYVAGVGGKWDRGEYTGGKYFVVLDGKKGPEFDYINRYYLTFSPDGKRYAYMAGVGGKWDYIDYISGYREYIYTGGKYFVVLDGEKGPEFNYIDLDYLTFSSDWKRVTYIAKEGKKYFVVLDSKKRLESDYVFDLEYLDEEKAFLALIERNRNIYLGRFSSLE